MKSYFFTVQDPLLMYPEENKKIGRAKNIMDEKDCDFYYSATTTTTKATTPLPPPRHNKQDTGKTSNFNLIEF